VQEPTFASEIISIKTSTKIITSLHKTQIQTTKHKPQGFNFISAKEKLQISYYQLVARSREEQLLVKKASEAAM